MKGFKTMMDYGAETGNQLFLLVRREQKEMTFNFSREALDWTQRRIS